MLSKKKKKKRSSQKFFRRSPKKKKKKKKKRSSQKFFKLSPRKNAFQKIFQPLHKILTIQKILLSSSRGQANFRGLEASRPRPRPRTSKSVLEDVLEAKDVLEDSTSASHILFDCKDFKQIPVEDRISFVKESKLCHKCLSSKHKTRECKRSKLCSVTGCKGFHHTLLHKFATTKEHPPKTSSEDKAVVPVTCGFTKSDSCSILDNSHVYLCIVPVRVSFGENVVSTYAFLDQGSTHSFCKRSLLQELKASGTRERLQLKTITGTTNDMDSVSCNLVVSDLDSDSFFSLSNVHSVENIPVQPNNVSVDAEVCKLPHLQDINLK